MSKLTAQRSLVKITDLKYLGEFVAKSLVFSDEKDGTVIASTKILCRFIALKNTLFITKGTFSVRN
jgi:hypothetical protein